MMASRVCYNRLLCYLVFSIAFSTVVGSDVQRASRRKSDEIVVSKEDIKEQKSGDNATTTINLQPQNRAGANKD